MKPIRTCSLFFALGIAVPAISPAQDYPAKPIHWILPTIPGSAYELTGRLLAKKMSESMGQPIVPENKAGANGIIGALYVAKAAPDGYTLLWATPSQTASAVYLNKDLPYDPRKDFAPITMGASPVTVMILNPKVPASNVREFVDYAKRNPGKISYGSPGIGSAFHLIGELINAKAGIDMVHVPYKGPTQAQNDLYAGRIEATIVTLGTATPLERSGKVKILGLLEARRYAARPDLPTFSETVPGAVKPPAWYALFGVAGTPRPIINRLQSELAAALKTEEVRGFLDKLLHEPGGMSPEAFAEEYEKAMVAFGEVVKAAGLKPQ